VAARLLDHRLSALAVASVDQDQCPQPGELDGDLAADPVSAAYVRSRTPFGRLGEPTDVAAAVAFLASDQATYISGVNLMVDGGWMAY